MKTTKGCRSRGVAIGLAGITLIAAGCGGPLRPVGDVSPLRTEVGILHKLHGVEGDYRDWDSIRAWAAEVADSLSASASA